MPSNYDTPIPKERQTEYQDWLKTKSKAVGHDFSLDNEDYDIQGLFMSGGVTDERGHSTDRFKKPNHPTFSTESQYHGMDGNVGGAWTNVGGKYSFTPSSTNLQHRNLGQLREYFDKYEPGITLNRPAASNYYEQPRKSYFESPVDILTRPKEGLEPAKVETFADADKTFRGIARVVHPIANAAATLAGGYGGGLPGAALGYGASDQVMQVIREKLGDTPETSQTSRFIPNLVPSGSFQDAVANTAEGFGAQEIGGKLIGKVISAFKANPVQDAKNYAAQMFGGAREPHQVASDLRSGLSSAEISSVAKSNAEAESAKGIARQNVVTFQTTAGPKIVEGPINPVRSSLLAKSYIDNLQRQYGVDSTQELFKIVADEQKPLLITANQILSSGGNPIPFSAAWDLDQAAAKIGNSGPGITYKKSQFNDLSSAIQADIRESMPQWQGGDTALNHFNTAKTIVSNRHELFDKGIINRIKENPDSPLPQVDQLLRDPEAIGKIRGTGVDITPLKSYQFQRMIQDSITKEGSFDAARLRNLIADPEMQASFGKLYNATERANINAFSDMVSKIDPFNHSSSMRIFSKMGPFSGSAWLSATALGIPYHEGAGIVFGANVLAKLLTSPKTAYAARTLFSTGPNSPEAHWAGRIVYGAIDGMKLVLQNPDGSAKNITIGEKD